MYKKNKSFVFSPSDLTVFSGSPFASWMDHFHQFFPEEDVNEDDDDDFMQLLQEKGYAHEQDVLQQLKEKGLSVIDIADEEDPCQASIEAMKQGYDVIFQAVLQHQPFRGHADFLVKVAGDSALGDYHYEVWDSKLSKSMKPYFVIQLCCYEDMLQAVQGRRSEEIVVVLGNGRHERLRTDDYFYYYLSLKQAFLALHEGFDPEQQPNPAHFSSWGHWSDYAKALLLEVDHLSQVATITRAQIKKFNKAGITTMQGLVDSDCPVITGINASIYARLKQQATLQKNSEGKESPLYEIVPEGEDKKGLSLLPPHSDKDVFFDIEGYPLAEGGLEYLWGNSYFDDSGARQFKDFWAHNQAQEKQCFQYFIQWVYGRWQSDPAMHIYHYANYEIAACKKLMGRYGVCEDELDQLLRNEVFVDLYKIVKSGLLIGEPRYSIKNVEHLYRGKRETAVGDGGASVVVYEQWRVNPDGETWQDSKILKDIRDYNIDDCDSTQELVDWLRARQIENKIGYDGNNAIVVPDIPELISERIQLRDKLLACANEIRESDPERAALTENMAWALEFHRREAKPLYWRLFERMAMTDIELLDDLDCLACCERTEREAFKPTPRARNLAYEYRFDVHQEFKASKARSFYLLGYYKEDGWPLGVTCLKDESNFKKGLVVIQVKEEPPTLISLIPNEQISAEPIPGAINRVVKAYDKKGVTQSALMDFLQRKPPRIKGLKRSQPIVSAHDPEQRLEQITQAIINLKNSYLTIQGPPGSGKTYTGKHVIAALLKLNKRIGICSNSHKAINNLLIGAVKTCQVQGIEGYFACNKNTDPELEELDVEIIGNPAIANHIDGPCIIGTTAWGFSRKELEKSFDYLFIDEAGQVSVSNLIAISQATNNLILMGDQMQLGQPTQGSHPAESGLSILDYLLHDSPTISETMGVFLAMTYRMHSAVNDFISHAIYEGKLESDPDNDQQLIAVPKNYQGPLDKEAGIIYIPIDHEGNQQASDEEVAAIKKLSKQLLGREFTDKEGNQRKIGWDDILYVAPYNLQVTNLQKALGKKARVGSVDKFQGQEAPIVFLSMCSSDAGDSPRGIDFLFDKHRINVAVSRAQAMTIVVANPTLRIQNASNIKQQNAINIFCRLSSR
ncbi:MAG: TM0106 family RecB-like putative nuclease [Gammaproteobacteria bacterium]|nr:TM0106 family RecB-like putative nuclease [Gammaproteobacteria bacterium]